MPGTAQPTPVKSWRVVAQRPPVSMKPYTTGLVFGKTDFRGLLKAAYARLTIIDSADPSKVYYFYVGSRENQNVLPWGKGEVIEPGYFFLQLPPGKYAVTAVAIPVGSTIAEESLALDMPVSLDRAYYLGTLRIDGIKERAKFGGVPLVRPGFEFTLAVDDEFEAARKGFEQLSPRHDLSVSKNLFKTK
ncbi:MAG: hypothetical protein WCO69_05000 [Candidatus Omnitrophota bacterium]